MILPSTSPIKFEIVNQATQVPAEEAPSKYAAKVRRQHYEALTGEVHYVRTKQMPKEGIKEQL